MVGWAIRTGSLLLGFPRSRPREESQCTELALEWIQEAQLGKTSEPVKGKRAVSRLLRWVTGAPCLWAALGNAVEHASEWS